MAPAVAAAAVALTACSNSEESAPADATYTLPPVFTGQPDPNMADGATAAAEHGNATPEADVAGFTTSLKNADGDQIGTVQLGDEQGSLTVDATLTGSGLQEGMYKLAVTNNGMCLAVDRFLSAGDIRTFGGGEGGTTFTLPVSSGGNGTVSTTIPGTDVSSLTGGAGSAVIVLDASDARVGCGVVKGA